MNDNILRFLHWFYCHPVMGTSVRQVYAPTGPLSINQCIRQYQNSVTFLFLFLTFKCFNEQESNNRLIPLHNLAYGHKNTAAWFILVLMSRISYIMSAAAIFGDVISLKEDASGLTFPPSCDITNLLQQLEAQEISAAKCARCKARKKTPKKKNRKEKPTSFFKKIW
ncbi:hypothetical protein OUZ56_002685 [Daphnia magna]|uniref:Uncharacterized protein n=1 Tax=Daphnia magna TaxID=35525 RepID=A0ABR0A6F5_9CRUS|nr:hypothetical protein OUZ56_002685 [Daphnia magna]